jgi:hypothetical protein
VTVIFCSSLTAQVLSGPVEILLDGAGVVTVPGGVTVRVAEIADGQFEIQHLGGTEPIVVEFQGQEETELAPGSSGTFPPPADSDGDGVPDSQDGCPADPAKTALGICGCGMADTDSDGDGIADCIDGCPADTNKTAPGICGCEVPDTDSDGDGTADCQDSCPTQAGPGPDGCPVVTPPTDSDGDGVPDDQDDCSGTPTGESVDANGCSGEQLITQLCPCAGPASGGTWKNHGEYVSCVTQAAQDMVDAGLITEDEKGDIVSDAAQSDCGQKK